MMVITITTPVPKSGSNIIKPNIKRRTPKIGRTPFFIFFSSLVLLARYLDVNIINPNFANSDGCSPKEPIPNQLLLPFLTVPIPGINTKISIIVHVKNIMLANFL